MSTQSEEFAFRNPVKQVGFAQLEHVIALDHELSDGAYRTLALYMKYAQQKDTCFPGIERIAKDRGKNVSTISRHNAELEALGYITRQRRTGTTTLTYIEDVYEIPRLKAVATDELSHRNNDRCKVAITQSVTLQKCDVEEEQGEGEQGEEYTMVPTAPDSPSPAIESPRTFQDWEQFLLEAPNKPAALRIMAVSLYGAGKVPEDNYGMIGRALKKHDLHYMAGLLWQWSARPPNGDPFKYVIGIMNAKNGNRRHTVPVDRKREEEEFDYANSQQW